MDTTQLGSLSWQRVQSEILAVYQLQNLAEANPALHTLKDNSKYNILLITTHIEIWLNP